RFADTCQSRFQTWGNAERESSARRKSPVEVALMRGDDVRAGVVTAMGAIVLVCAMLPACSINVKKEKDGQDKQVDIKTLVGGIHVSKDVDAADVGIAVYPGARLKPKDDSGNDKSANVNISGFGFALKVVAMQYESDDPPSKLV